MRARPGPSPIRAARLALTAGALALGLWGAWSLPARGAAGTVLRFADATAGSGIDYRNLCGAPPAGKGWIPETIGAGAAWLDYDGDGRLDLYLVNGSAFDRPAGGGEPNRLFKGDGRGRFADVTQKAGVGDRGWGFGAAVGDIDNDGDPDLYVTNLGPNVLYRNNGDGTFTDVTAAAGVGDAAWGTSAAFFDADRDGDLDLYVCNYIDFDRSRVPRVGSKEAVRQTCMYRGVPVVCGPLGLTPAQDVFYRNNGDGTFSEATRASGLWLATPRFALGAVTGDYDGDGVTDLYVANDSVQNSLWRNRGDGTFEDVAIRTLSALNSEGSPQAGMGTDFGDADGDGWLDLVVTNFSHDLNTIYRNVSGKYFLDLSFPLGMAPTYMALSWATAFHDFDRDGDEDLFIANGHVYPQVDDYDIGTRYRQANHLFVNEGSRGTRFREVSSQAGPAFRVVRSFRGAAFGDYDDDGDMDVLVTALDEPVLLMRNDTPPAGRFLQVRLIGTRSNRDAVGARVTVTAGGRTLIRERKGGGSYLSASDPRLHFGLGAAARIDRLEVRWPSGQRETLTGVAPDRLLTLVEGKAGAGPR